MNKAITDGVLLMPPVFANGLDVWSSGDGTPGSDTYENAINAAYVPADQDFSGCLEMVKTESTQKLRHMGQTPILPGCYLRVTARVKAVSGNLPSVRIAAWAGDGSGNSVTGITTTGPSQTLTSYGEVVEINAIVGAGDRGGVDMVWGNAPVYGHFGLDLTGSNGGFVRIDDIVIEDITSAFLRSMMNWVDVRDYGAIGDGVTNDAPAFEAANADAGGRSVLVSEGTYYLGDNVTFDTRAVFEGTVVMPEDKYLSLTKNFDLPSYIEAFGDESLVFKKAFQSLLNNSDHETLDLGGRRVTVTEPIDMQAAVSNNSTYAQRRVIRNGQFYVAGDTAWDPEVTTSVGSYSVSNDRTLSNVTNVANVQIGSLVTGNGVGREVYVRGKNEATQELTLSQPLFDAVGTQNYTFTRYKYVLDFSGFAKLSSFVISDVDFLCNSKASGILMAIKGLIFHVKDCFFTEPKHRGITSPGDGCKGMLIDRFNFTTAEGGTPAQDRVSVAINSNANDVKVRNNRASQFRHFYVSGGANSIITGNHFFQGDDETAGLRTAGIILTQSHCSTTIDGNYVDNCSIEWTNEYDPEPDFTSGFSFSALSVTDNVFLSGNVAPWFFYLVIKPHGAGHSITGLSVTGNKFRSIQGTAIDRVDRVDTSYGDLGMSRGKHVLVEVNTFHAVETPIYNSLVIEHDQNSTAQTWVVDSDDRLPFGGHARSVESVVMIGKIKNSNNVTEYTVPYVTTEQGSGGDQLHLTWEKPVSGNVAVRMRMD
ncbi:right-handed parallel beta-helix repeat-containing protein [uncultured Shimia sp.]|uniref:right-handed parallel beta-helix repeat-containing protein n=1 Tax=uncultured Shimia sp. TaxID=573152 RepID=UPI002606157F|nr:right-handed parallel beta-helix repeat-containing protein [uncultured Shimia sp.]